MTKQGAFSGIKLTEQVLPPTASVDQRLFRPVRSPSSAEGKENVRLESQETSNLATQESGKPAGKTGSQQAKSEEAQESRNPGGSAAAKPAGKPFDLNKPPYRKATFMVTDGEFEALEDLKLNLRREHRRDLTKNDLMRLALHIILEDYEERPGSSLVLRRLKERAKR